MIATTMSISIRVKPFRLFSFFISFFIIFTSFDILAGILLFLRGRVEDLRKNLSQRLEYMENMGRYSERRMNITKSAMISVMIGSSRESIRPVSWSVSLS